MTQELYIKYLKNQCSDAEIDEVINWLNAEALNEKNRNWVFEIWNSHQSGLNENTDEKFSSLLDKIHHRINLNEANITDRKNKQSLVSLSLKWITRIAAVLLLPVLGFLFFTISQKTKDNSKYSVQNIDSIEIVAPVGSRSVVQLSDGSLIHLNFGSKLKYPQKFAGNSREVQLTGEGFFEVAHNSEMPFIVKTGSLNIKALGTRFNVQAYPDDDVIATTLVDGKVVIENEMVSHGKKTVGSLVPGQHVDYYTETGKVESEIGNINKYIAWKDGKIVFENESIIKVAERLSRMFNVEIEINENISDYSYTVTIVDESLYQILDLMTIATPVRYKTLPRKKLSDGSFSKQRIIIEKKE